MSPEERLPDPAPDVAPAGFREIDHSGDIGIEAWGPDRARLLENATRGLFGLMAWRAEGGDVERRVEVGDGPGADVLVDWLGAVILLAAAHGEVYSGVTVEHAGDDGARGWLRGARFDAARHALRFDVKAATYHDIRFEEAPDGSCRARVIFDL